MPKHSPKIKLTFYDIYRNGIKEISFYGLKGAFNYICATSVNSGGTPMKSYEQITRLVLKHDTFAHSDSLGTRFLIKKSKLYK